MKYHVDGTLKSTDDSSSSNDEDDQPSVKKGRIDTLKTSTTVCYICQLSPLPGKFFPKKAIELGVPKGHLFGELVSGKTVTLDDGRQVCLKSQYYTILVLTTK